MGFRFLIWCALGLAVASAAQIEGTITIHRRLTRRKVTLVASAYERGATVRPDSTGEPDALAFERAHVIIFLEGNIESTPVTAVMDQKNKEFVPDLLAISAGSTVSFLNLDPIFHNVFSLSGPREFDLGNYPMNKTRLVTFRKPGIVFVNCHLHPNMTAAIVVTPNSFFARSDGNGHFKITDVPRGDYTVVAWHKAAGFFRRKISVGNDPVEGVNFLIPVTEP